MELEELIRRIDIVEYISQFVDLELKGGEWWGLSPFKDEATPSFSVHQEKQVFYDFSSGESGNVFTFVKLYRDCSSRTAIDILKEYAGEDAVDLCVPNKFLATSICKKYKRKQKQEKAYTASVLPEDYMDRFVLDWGKLKVWEDEGITKDSMTKYLVKYDPISNRIVYPIRDLGGAIVNVGMRTLDPNWKEKKLRKYTYISGWGTIKTMFGYSDNIESIKQRKEIIIFEGAKSVMKADGWGFENSVALMTSHLSDYQMRILCKLGVEYGVHAVFALDNDIVVRKDKNIMKLKNFINVFYISDSNGVLDEKDSPVDKGEETFRKLYEGRYRL